MRIVIEAREFADLSRETQLELLGRFGGEGWRKRAKPKRASVLDEDVIDLTPIKAAQLVDSLSEDHRRFLQVFAQRGGRVRLDELCSAVKPSDAEGVSRLTRAIDDKVRALAGGEAAGKSLFAREGDRGEASVYRVSEPTTRSLRCFFPVL